MFESRLQSLPLVYRGKVRDTYALGDERLLIITSDRISAFDVVMREPIPGKGQVLNAMSNFWFARLADIGPNHLTGIDPTSVVPPAERDQVEGRAVVAQRLRPLPIEAVVRGYLAGSGWSDYSRDGRVCGLRLPAGLQQAQRLPEPLFTPAHKAELGTHDENISFEQVADRSAPSWPGACATFRSGFTRRRRAWPWRGELSLPTRSSNSASTATAGCASWTRC